MYGAQQTLDYSDEPVIIVYVSQSRERCLEAALRDFSQQLQIRLKLILVELPLQPGVFLIVLHHFKENKVDYTCFTLSLVIFF